jgi:serine/threonine protein kinase
MGEVYLAVDQNLKRDVALKVLPPEFERDAERVARFRREATLAAALNHPNICTIYEVNNADGRTFIAMEYVEGVTLRERIQARPMEIGEILDIGIQIADALDEARKKNIVHRDIKSANILLTPRDQAKVLDFGLAKAFDAEAGAEGATATELTQPGGVVGTVSYMSPEQALGKPLDHRSDIFSSGVVLYEMITGRLPFAEGSSQEILNTIVNKNPRRYCATPRTSFRSRSITRCQAVISFPPTTASLMRTGSIRTIPWLRLPTCPATIWRLSPKLLFDPTIRGQRPRSEGRHPLDHPAKSRVLTLKSRARDPQAFFLPPPGRERTNRQFGGMSCGVTSPRTLNSSQAKSQPPWFQEAVDRRLSGVMPWIDGTQQVWARHADFHGKLFNARGPDGFAERMLERDPFVYCRKQKLPGEFRIPEVLCQSLIPILTASRHVALLPDILSRTGAHHGCLSAGMPCLRRGGAG